jgi:opacity protein-like surface antigen
MAGGGASLMYGENRQRVSWGASAGTQYNKLFDVDDFDMYAYNGGASMAVGLSQRSSLSLGVNAAVQPFFQFGLVGTRGMVDTQVPGGALPVFQGPGFNAGTSFTPDLQASQLQLLQYGAGAGYQYRLGPRTNAHAMAGYSSFRPLGEDAPVNFGLGFMGVGMRSVGGGISHAVSQNLSARAGYYYRTFEQPMAGVSESVVGHDIDVGMNYNRGFEVARRTTVSFGTGSSVMRTSGTLAGQTETRTFAFVTGNANLTRLFLRTWSSSVSYIRGVSYVAGLQGFALNDTVAANVAGLFTDRLDASAGVTYTSGAFGFSGGGERFQTASAGGQLRYGLSRNLATFVSYSYARFNFPSSMLLPAGFPNAASRQGIRGGLTFWFDVLR